MSTEQLLFPQDFPKFLAEQLIKRQEIVKRSKTKNTLSDSELLSEQTFKDYVDEDLGFLLGKVSWCRMMSNAIPRQWPPTKMDSNGNFYVIPNWDNDGQTSDISDIKSTDKNTVNRDTSKYSWRPEDDTRTISKYDIRAQTILYGGSLLTKDLGKDNNGGSIKTMMPRGGFEELYGPRSYGFIENVNSSGELSPNDNKIAAFLNENFDYRPPPGIVSVNVSLKTPIIRQATIKWNCYSWEEFEIYERLYLTPGLSVFLDWGWTTPNEMIPLMDFSLNFRKPREYFKRLNGAILKSNGKYDGMVGVISNFSYSMNGNIIECTTEIMSPNDMIGNSAIVNPEIQNEEDNVKGFINNLAESEETGKTIKTKRSKLLSEEDTKITIHKVTWGSESKTTDKYITWLDFEKILTAYALPPIITDQEETKDTPTTSSSDGKKDSDKDKTDDKDDKKQKEKNKIKDLDDKKIEKKEGEDVKQIENTDIKKEELIDDGNLFVIKSYDTGVSDEDNTLIGRHNKTISNNPFLCSCDPKVCLLPGQIFLSTNLNSGTTNTTELTTAFPKISDNTIVPFYFNTKLSDTDNPENKTVGVLNNMLLNLKWLKEQFENVDTLKVLFEQKIYKGISDACGNMFKFSFISNIYDPFIMQTHDDYQCSNKATAMMFKARANDSILKSISVTGQIPGGAMGSRLWILSNSTDVTDDKKSFFTRDSYVDGFMGQMSQGAPKVTKEKWNEMSEPEKKDYAKKNNKSLDQLDKELSNDTKDTKEKTSETKDGVTKQTEKKKVVTKQTEKKKVVTKSDVDKYITKLNNVDVKNTNYQSNWDKIENELDKVVSEGLTDAASDYKRYLNAYVANKIDNVKVSKNLLKKEDVSPAPTKEVSPSNIESDSNTVKSSTSTKTSEQTDTENKKESSSEVTAETEEDEDKNASLSQKLENKIVRFYGALKKVYENYSPEMVGTAKARLAQLLQTTHNILTGTQLDNRLYPIDLTVSMDGTSGFLFNQAITTNLIPYRFFSNVVFRTTEITHDITQGGWTVSLKGVMQVAPPTYNVWVRKQNVPNFEIEPYSIKNFESYSKLLNKLNYGKIAERIRTEQVKVVKLKDPVTKTDTSKNGSTAPGGSNTSTKTNKTNSSLQQNTGNVDKDGTLIYNVAQNLSVIYKNNYAIISISTYGTCDVALYLYKDGKQTQIITTLTSVTSHSKKTYNFEMSLIGSGKYEIHAWCNPKIITKFPVENGKNARYQAHNLSTSTFSHNDVNFTQISPKQTSTNITDATKNRTMDEAIREKNSIDNTVKTLKKYGEKP